MDMEKKAVKARSGILEGNAGTMKSLTQAQEATGKAHFVIQVCRITSLHTLQLKF